MRCARRTVLALLVVTAVASSAAWAGEISLIAQADETVATKEASLKKALFQMRDAIDRYYVANQRYPKDLKTLQTDGYLGTVPNDPFTNSNRSWRPIKARRTVSDTTPGIYDVKSSSQRVAKDGTKYSDW